MQELPLGAKPYLWVSTEMEVTPGERKSKKPSDEGEESDEENGAAKPALESRGTRKEPRQQSTWRGREY